VKHVEEREREFSVEDKCQEEWEQLQEDRWSTAQKESLSVVMLIVEV
jgi:cell division protein FtsL